MEVMLQSPPTAVWLDLGSAAQDKEKHSWYNKCYKKTKNETKDITGPRQELNTI